MTPGKEKLSSCSSRPRHSASTTRPSLAGTTSRARACSICSRGHSRVKTLHSEPWLMIVRGKDDSGQAQVQA